MLRHRHYEYSPMVIVYSLSFPWFFLATFALYETYRALSHKSTENKPYIYDQGYQTIITKYGDRSQGQADKFEVQIPVFLLKFTISINGNGDIFQDMHTGI